MSRFSNSWIKSYFKFSKKDRNGILVLSVLITAVLLTNIIIDYIPVRDEKDYTELLKALAEWEDFESAESNNSKFLFPFNPNTISGDSLDSLLLPEFVKRNLISYRNAGGKINSASDFRRIYGMNDSVFFAIRDFIVIPQEYPTKPINAGNNNKIYKVGTTDADYFSEASLTEKIELNVADSAQLTKLYGIGPVFASRIIKYRNLLGGFYSGEQLLEVYNFPVETYNSISGHIIIDVSEIRQIRLNFAEFSELLRHPYMNKKQVESIINYRTNNGAFESVEDLLYLDLLDSTTFVKVSPYLNCR